MENLHGYFYSSNVDRNDRIPFDLKKDKVKTLKALKMAFGMGTGNLFHVIVFIITE